MGEPACLRLAVEGFSLSDGLLNTMRLTVSHEAKRSRFEATMTRDAGHG